MTSPRVPPLTAMILPGCDLVILVATAMLVKPPASGAVYAILVFAVLHVTGRHNLRICLRVLDEIGIVAAAAFLPVVVLLPWLSSAGEIRRLVELVAASVFLLVAARAAVYGILRAAHRAGLLTEATLIIGTVQAAREVADLLVQHRELGLRPVGFIGDGLPGGSTPQLVRGDFAAIPDFIRDYRVRRLILAVPVGQQAALISTVQSVCPPWVTAHVVSPARELTSALPSGYRDEIWGVPLTPVRRSDMRPAQRLTKRTFDLIVSTALLVPLAPILVALVIAQLVACGRPVIFRQDRVTYLGRTMKIMKFRTIRRSTNPDSQWTVDDADCSPIGHWLRATHLDELPQLFNVIRGDMSLVGPRPERPFFTARFATEIPNYEDRHRTSAGLTGWAQVHGLTGDTSIAERVRFDNYYIDHWSLWLDIAILMRTVFEPVAGMVRVRRARRERGLMISSADVRHAIASPMSDKNEAGPDGLEAQLGPSPEDLPARAAEDGAT